jgi:hypothetical protein
MDVRGGTGRETGRRSYPHRCLEGMHSHRPDPAALPVSTSVEGWQVDQEEVVAMAGKPHQVRVEAVQGVQGQGGGGGYGSSSITRSG